MKYYSTSKRKEMDVSEMHMMHLENVLLKDLKHDDLSGREQAGILAEYIKKSQLERQKLHVLLKHSAGLTGLLFDLAVKFKKKPAKPQPSPHLHAAILEFYRQLATGFIKKYGRISADQLRSTLERSGYTVHGQSLTHVFRDPRFIQEGYRRSAWDGAKGRYINTWIAA